MLIYRMHNSLQRAFINPTRIGTIKSLILKRNLKNDLRKIFHANGFVRTRDGFSNMILNARILG